ncbi:MAG: NAD(P)H-hydrate epimerase [Elusimicrobia bacterium]|nr:NAD(P)H-hydrate epimerase [Elusimicrobiota bacterium]
MKEPIPEVWEGLPVVSAAAMRALDQAAVEKHGIKALDLMENAGKAVAAECAAFLAAKGVALARADVVVCCGRGANGGDGLVAARHLRAGGAAVGVFLCPPKNDGSGGGKYPELVRVNLAAAKAAGVTIVEAGPESGLAAALARCDLAIDALLGTGSNGKPAGAVHHMIRELTRAKKPVIAVDIPSGLHPDTGYHSGVFVAADLTLTLGLPKRGLLAPHAKPQVGVLKVLDIGYPPALLKGRSLK